MELVGEPDLTLSLKCGGSEETRTIPPIFLRSKKTTIPFIFLGSEETTTPFFFLEDSLQTNLPLMETDFSNLDLSLNLNPNISSSLASFSNNDNTYLSLASCNHNANPPNTPAKAIENVSSVNSFQTNSPLLQTLCCDHNFNSNPSLLSFSDKSNTSLSTTSCNENTNPPNAPAEATKNVSTVTRSLGRSRQTSCTRRSKRMSETVPTLFPWAKNQRASVHSKQYLLENNINTIKGKVHCKRCEHEFELSLNLEEKLNDLCQFISKGKHKWHNRAPRVWMSPMFPRCPICGRESSNRPIIAKNKKEINWLFLLLGQMLGCCTLNHLKYFCKHNEVHRTGAKDRLLYDIYKNLVNQLLPGFFV